MLKYYYMDSQLKEYEVFLDNLATTKSPEIFTNGGIQHASILMSKLLQYTNTEACFFSEGFKPELIMNYYESLKSYLESGKQIKVLLEKNDYVNDDPFQLLVEFANKRKENGDVSSIQCRLITKESRAFLENLNSSHYNFSVFDNDKFRLEFDPENYRAMGSFNDEIRVLNLKNIFYKAFEASEPLIN